MCSLGEEKEGRSSCSSRSFLWSGEGPRDRSPDRSLARKVPDQLRLCLGERMEPQLDRVLNLGLVPGLQHEGLHVGPVAFSFNMYILGTS